MQMCTKCKQDKDAEQFHRNTLTTSGLVSRCKQCIAEADAKRCTLLSSSLLLRSFRMGVGCLLLSACTSISSRARITIPMGS